MPASILRFADYPVMPWRNGRGETREIARTPSHGEFAWRLSMATVSEDAMFSEFPGVTRTLAIVGGGALDLQVDGVQHRLELGGPAVTFSGTAASSAKPVTATVTDLNLMVRGELRGSIEPLHGGVEPGAGVTMVIALVDALMTPAGRLDRLDTLILGDEAIGPDVGPGYVVRITER